MVDVKVKKTYTITLTNDEYDNLIEILGYAHTGTTHFVDYGDIQRLASNMREAIERETQSDSK